MNDKYVKYVNKYICIYFMNEVMIKNKVNECLKVE